MRLIVPDIQGNVEDIWVEPAAAVAADNGYTGNASDTSFTNSNFHDDEDGEGIEARHDKDLVLNNTNHSVYPYNTRGGISSDDSMLNRIVLSNIGLERSPTTGATKGHDDGQFLQSKSKGSEQAALENPDDSDSDKSTDEDFEKLHTDLQKKVAKIDIIGQRLKELIEKGTKKHENETSTALAPQVDPIYERKADPQNSSAKKSAEGEYGTDISVLKSVENELQQLRDEVAKNTTAELRHIEKESRAREDVLEELQDEKTIEKKKEDLKTELKDSDIDYETGQVRAKNMTRVQQISAEIEKILDKKRLKSKHEVPEESAPLNNNLEEVPTDGGVDNHQALDEGATHDTVVLTMKSILDEEGKYDPIAVAIDMDLISSITMLLTVAALGGTMARLIGYEPTVGYVIAGMLCESIWMWWCSKYEGNTNHCFLRFYLHAVQHRARISIGRNCHSEKCSAAICWINRSVRDNFDHRVLNSQQPSNTELS